MFDEGLPAESIRAVLKLSRTTYFQWKRAYETRGVEGVRVRPVPGGTPKLTDAQTSQLVGWLVGRDPRQFQFDFALWTRTIVRELIRQKFGVEMTPQGIGKLLGASGCRRSGRCTAPTSRIRTRWTDHEFPAIREQARSEGAQLFFGDEAGIPADCHSGTTWAPVGQTPVVKVTGERGGVNMISAVSPAGVVKFDVFVGRFDVTVFVEFLKKLMHDAPGPVYLILDNMSVHKAKTVNEYVASLNGRLKLFFLPGYSPELNPDEWVWKNVKHDQVGRAGVVRKSELFGLVSRALARLQQLPDVVRGFFRDPALTYIGM